MKFTNAAAFAVLGFAFASSAALAGAVTVDFGSAGSPTACANNVAGTGALVACGNGSYINQAYGDVAGVNLSYLQGPSTAMEWWGPSYSNLYGVLWGGVTGGSNTVTLQATSAAGVMLKDFDLSGYYYNTGWTALTVTDLASQAVVYSYAGYLGNSVVPVDLDLSSANGFQIQWNNDRGYNGIDNISFEVPVSTMPEPASLALMGLALSAVALVHRRRRG